MELAQKRKIAVAAYLLYVVVYYLILFLEIEPFSSYTSTFGLIGDCIGMVLFWIGLRHHPEDRRKPWIWFAATTVLYSIGEALWAYYSEFLGVDPSSPSACDFFYVSNSLTSFYAFICYIRLMNIDLRSVAFDILISTFAVGGILFNFVLLPLLQNESAEFLPLLINLTMSTVDLTFFVGLLLLIFSSDSRLFFTPRVLLMGLAFLCFFAVDQLTIIFAVYEMETPPIIEPFWSFPLVLLGFVSTFPDVEEKELAAQPAHPQLERVLEYARALLPYLFTFIIQMLVGIHLGITHPLFIWSIILIVALSLRQIGILLRNRRLMETIQENEKRLNLQNYELQRLNQQILRDAEVDFLTQLANRRYIDQSFDRLAPPEGVEKTLGLLLIDVDFFKRINDSYGHQVGDLILQQVAACIRSIIRGGDIAGRFGGDEFIVLLPSADISATAAVAERLQEKIRENPDLISRNVTLSIGCASQMITSQNYNSDQLLKQADEALYRAKEGGRNRYVVYSDPA